jgi:hypothetical protein
MKSFSDYMKARNVEIPEGNIPGSWFSEHRLPMVVSCACCEMTMVLPSAFIDEDGYIYCSDCAGVSED